MRVLYVILAGISVGVFSANADELGTLVERVKKDTSKLNYQERILYLDDVINKQESALAKFYRVRANSYYALEDYRAAELDYRKALLDSKSGNIEYAIGKSLLEQVKYHEALDMFRLALKKCTYEAERHEVYQYKYNIALCLFEIRQHDDAIAMFDQLKKDYPEQDMSAVFAVINAHKQQKKVLRRFLW